MDQADTNRTVDAAPPGDTLAGRGDRFAYGMPPHRTNTAAKSGHYDSETPAAQLVTVLPALRLLTGLLIAALIIAALYFGRDLLIPLALAILLSFLLDPAVARLKRWGVPRMAAVLLVVGLTVAALGGAGAYLGSQVTALSKDLPSYQTTIREKFTRMRKAVKGPGALDGALSTYNTVERELAKTTGQPAPGAAATGRAIQRVEIIPAPKAPMAQLMEWLGIVSAPVLMAGMVLLFVILILLGRSDLRERLLRLMGGNLHLATDALDDAAERIGRYLRMQMIVNATYGIPLGVALYFIGVPGAVLWGTVAAVMRFVPYIGPMLSAAFPLALAFAIDPTWDMLLWTLGVILVLELLSNNVIEPWLYGSSTGLSTLSIIVSAMFWTAIWGPIGLILSTPLTVCLLVLGRYIPSLQFMEVLLGSDPVLAPPQRLYQRLLGGGVEEAIEMTTEAIDAELPSPATPAGTATAVTTVFDEIAIPALRLACERYADVATAQHRLRLVHGMSEVLEEVADAYPPTAAATTAPACGPRILCIGGRWEVDALAAGMMAHALALHGHDARHESIALSAGANPAEAHRLDGVQILCLSVFHPRPGAQVRHWARRLTRRWPDLRIVLALWNAPPALLAESAPEQLGVTAIVNSMHELVLRLATLTDTAGIQAPMPQPADDGERVARLYASGALAPHRTEGYRLFLQRVVDVFDVRYAQLAWLDRDWVHTPGSLLPGGDAGIAREEAICARIFDEDDALVIPDIARDPRFAGSRLTLAHSLRFYGSVPLKDRDGYVLGCLALLDTAPRELSDEEIALLNTMATEFMATLATEAPAETAVATTVDTAAAGAAGSAAPITTRPDPSRDSAA